VPHRVSEGGGLLLLSKDSPFDAVMPNTPLQISSISTVCLKVI